MMAMPQSITIHRDRTNIIPVSLGYDVSGDTFTSEIRKEADTSSDKLAEFTISFETDGTDGELILTLDNSAVALVTSNRGFMDIKRLSAGEPLPVFDEPLEVFFKGSVTA
jgi:hypothetical protein